MKHRTRSGLLVTLSALLGCASTVDGAAPPADTSDPSACPHWVLTDREERTDGELYTDLHLTFDPSGRLQRRREHIRTGGHGMNRTFREFAYAWSPAGLTVTQVDAPAERVTYTLDGANLVERTNASASVYARRVVRYTRDAAGRVIERAETRELPATTVRCSYAYDAAGHLVQVECSDGDLTRYQWEADRPVRRDRSWRGRYPGVDTWTWDASGALLSETHDDGYGPGRAYRYDHAYDARGLRVRTESTSGTPSVRRPVAAYAYDDRGRLVREERGFDASGVARTVVLWERDAEGRIARRSAGDGAVGLRYSYDVTPQQVEVTTTAGTWRSWRRYRCFQTPVRIEPVEAAPGVPIGSANPDVEHYPVARPDP
jgi:YD repeat-containing protein